MEILLIGLNILLIALIIYLIISVKSKNNNIDVDKLKDSISEDIEDVIKEETKEIKSDLKSSLDQNTALQLKLVTDGQKTQTEMLLKLQEMQQKDKQESNQVISEQLTKMLTLQAQQAQENASFQSTQFETIFKTNNEQQQALIRILQEKLTDLQTSNEEKLDKIQGVVNEKLDKTLNERLDSNFKQIGDQLGELYKTLGELNKLSSGVTDLNKTLSNVKTRGTWGEIQLQSILEQTMTPAQYDSNIATKKNSSDRVEFAIKIPSKESDSAFIYLPIDSKMPSDIYNRIVDASIASNQQALSSACKELEQRIKTEARTIRDKYIDPPNTTDFAIMFLPTEGLYAEALRISGLAEWCQTQCRVVISGPTTITALLNSLRLGFSNMALSKKSQEVLKLLQAIKTQYSTFSELIEKTQKKLHEAINSTDNLKNRTDIIQRKMAKVEQLELNESNSLLGIEESYDE